MHKKRRWGKRILAMLLTAALLSDTNTVVLAEEIRDQVIKIQEEYQQEHAWQKQLQEIETQVLPGQTEGDQEKPEEALIQTEEKNSRNSPRYPSGFRIRRAIPMTRKQNWKDAMENR